MDFNWAIQKLKETLSNKIYSPLEAYFNDGSIEVEDVKEAVKELTEEILKDQYLQGNELLDKIKKIFGEKLI